MGRPRVDEGTPEQIEARLRMRQDYQRRYVDPRTKFDAAWTPEEKAAAISEWEARMAKRKAENAARRLAKKEPVKGRDIERAGGHRRRKSETLSKPTAEPRRLATVMTSWPADSIIKPPTLAQLMSGRA